MSEEKLIQDFDLATGESCTVRIVPDGYHDITGAACTSMSKEYRQELDKQALLDEMGRSQEKQLLKAIEDDIRKGDRLMLLAFLQPNPLELGLHRTPLSESAFYREYMGHFVGEDAKHEQ